VYMYGYAYIIKLSQMKNSFGNTPVYGANFFGRSEFVRQLVGILLSGNSFLLLGLRRIGKSSTVKEAIYQVKKQDQEVIIIELNCQNYRSIEDFYKHLNLALPLSWRQQLRKSLKDSKRIPTKLIDFITDHIGELDFGYIGSVKLRNEAISYSNPIKEEITNFFAQRNKQIILFVDELPFLFEQMAKSKGNTKALEIESILTVLRAWREVGVAQAICGSLNLHLQLEHLEISRKLLAGVNTQILPQYTRDEAFGLLQTLSQHGNVDLKNVEIDEMLLLIPDFIPQFLQYFFFVINTHWEGQIDNISSLYDKYVYPIIVSDFEYQFNDILSKFSQEHLFVVKKILNMILLKGNVSENDLLTTIKENDAYSTLNRLLSHELIVLNKDQTYSFALNTITNWWKKKNL